jgi:iodotyrosine deiodinase
MTDPAHIPYAPRRLAPAESIARGQAFFDEMNARRSVRFFAPDPVPRGLIEQAIRTASTAPSGANMQPWTFVAVSDPSIKHAIRVAAEDEERAFYETKIPDDWREALAPMGTDWHKPFLDIAPWLVVVFAQSYSPRPDGSRRKHYYVAESVGIACGLFIAALHRMGLSTLTHTPSPMHFLAKILGRPDHEKASILFPVGYAAPDATVPNLRRKSLDEVAVFKE